MSATVHPRFARIAKAWMFPRGGHSPGLASLTTLLERVVAEERERCAKICDEISHHASKPDNKSPDNPLAIYKSAACKCAWEIRHQQERT
jgi:hypothetical protein